MMSGLRSQRERMMTWVSLRSGVASRGKCIMDQTPHIHAMPTRAKTRNLFLTEALMMRLIIAGPRVVESRGGASHLLLGIVGGSWFLRMLTLCLAGAGHHLRT